MRRPKISPRSFFKNTRKVLRFTVPIFLLIGIIAGIQLAIRMKLPTKAEASWFDQGWGFRQRYPLTNSSGSLQTDFQVQFTIDTATLITAGQLRSDCGDVRFINQSGKLSSYWIEPGTCNTSTTKIWVKVDSIPTTGADVWFYYGNPSATGQSNTKTTFIREIPNLQAAWMMNESSWTNDCSTSTVLDTSGNSFHGKSCPNGTGPTGGATGKFNNGGSFDGSNDYIEIPGVNYANTYSGNFTACSWINPTNTNLEGFMGWNHGNSFPFYSWELYKNTTNLVFQSYDGTLRTAQTTVPTAGQWTYVCASVEIGKSIKLYVNGSLAATTAITSTVLAANPNSTDKTYLGWRLSGNQFFTGTMDDARIYTRALYASEISDLYGTGGDRQGYTTTNYPGKELVRKFNTSVTIGSAATAEVGTGPTVWYKFDENTGTSTKDSSTNANTGTLGGTTIPTWQAPNQCESGNCLYFDGSTSKVTGSKVAKTIQSISFWIRPNTIATQGVLNLDGGTHKISTNGSGVLTATGFTSPTYYVNGLATTTPTLVINQWNYVTITTGTSFDTTASFTVGTDGTNFIKGFIDDVKFYSYARSAAQAKADYLIGASAIGSSSVTGSQPPALSQGLAGYWKFDESSWTIDCSTGSVLNYSGVSGINGASCPATTGPAAGGAGKFGNGLALDATNDYVQVPAGTPITPSFTASAWAKSGASSWNDYGWIASARGSNGFIIHPYAGGSFWSAVIFNSAGGFTEVFAPAATTITNWHMYTISYDATRSVVKMYFDGTLVTTSNVTINRTSGTLPALYFGSDGGGGRYGNGSLDEERVYDRALSDSEVQQLYNFAPGPVGYWQFEEGSGTTVVDKSGYGNTATWTGTSANHWQTGKNGRAAGFDGTNDYLTVPHAASIDPTKGWTLESWVKRAGTSAQNSLLEKYDNTGSAGNYIMRISSSDKLQGYVVSGPGANGSCTGTTSLAANVWYHTTVTYDSATTTLKCYVNGVLENSSTSVTPAPNTSSVTLKIGARGNDVGTKMNGLMDEAKIYNYARSPAQIIEDMQGTNNLIGSTVGGGAASNASVTAPGTKPNAAVGYWKFDEGQGTTANNKGSLGSTANGTLTSMSSPATATSGWKSPGKVNKALSFDGTNDYVNVPDNGAFNPGTADYAISTWIRSTTSSGNIVAIGKYNGSGTNYWLGLSSGAASFNSQSAHITATTTISDGNWHHLAGVRKDAVIYLYVDGVLKGSSADSSTLSPGGYLAIGSFGNQGSYWNGSIDEVKFFASALTAEQVRQEYNLGTAVNYSVGATESASLIDGPGAEPVAYWNFEERSGTSVSDKSGNENTGTWNGTTGNQWATGKFGAAGNFNGTDNYVGAGNGTSLQLSSNGSVSAWIYPTAYPTAGSYKTIVSKGNWTAGTNDYSIYFDGTSNLRYEVNGSAFTGSGTIANTFTPLNQWSHIEMTWNGTTITIYVNGVSRGSISMPLTPDTTSNPLRIGAPSNNGGYLFSGKIDEVKVYNYARTAGQVAYDYNRGAPVAWYKFDACQGTVIQDSSGVNGSATLNIGASGTQTAAGTCSTSSTAWGNGASGKFNSGMNFDGTDDDITSSNVSALPTGANPRTLSLWVYPTATTLKSIMGYGTAAGLQMFDVLLYNGIIGIHWHGNGVSGEFSHMTYTLNAWNHVVFTYDGSVLRGYMNGVLKDSTPVTLNTTSSGTFKIGNGIYGSYNYFGGKVDDVRFYNYQMSPAQVRRLYNNDQSAFYGPASGSP